VNFFQSSYRACLLAALLLAAGVPLAFGQPSSRALAKPTLPTMAERLAAAQKAEPVEPPGQPMPDEGPHPEGRLLDIDGLTWQEGQAAYRNHAWTEARRSFETIIKQHPSSPLVPSALAFLIELSLKQDSSSRNRS